MAEIELVINALDVVNTSLAERRLRPAPERSDWASARPAVDRMREQVETLLTRWSTVEPTLAGEAAADGVRAAVARAVADSAAVLYLSGQGQPSELMRQAARIGGQTGAGRLVAAGVDAPADYARLTWAEWLFQQGEGKQARREAEALTARTSGPIAEAAAALLDLPQRTKRPPTLHTINGIGTTIYGKRDARPDGSYVKTRFFALLFVPVLPLDAWRVRDAPDRGWYFQGKVPLGPIATWWRRAVAVGVALLVVSGLWSAYYSGAGQRYDRAVTAAEAEADPAARRAAYAAIADDFGDEAVDHDRIAGPLVELAAAEVPATPTVADAPAIEAAFARIEGLPDRVRRAAGDPMATRALGWVESIGAADDAALALGAAVAKRAEQLAVSDAVEAEAAALWTARMTRRAEALAGDWPIEAVRVYAEMGTPEAAAAALARIEALDPGMSVWIELAPALDAMAMAARARRADVPALDAALAEVRRAEQAAAEPARQALLASDDAAALRAAVEATPGDHDLAARLADVLTAQGDVEGAEAALSRLGPPGRLGGAAQRALADLWAEAGRLDEADALLSRVVAARLPRFEAARRAYEAAEESFRARKIRELERAGPASPLQSVIKAYERAEGDEAKGRVIADWLTAQMDADRKLQGLRASYVALGDVVSAALSLGTIKLRRANGAAGEARARLLAEAEAAFLSIQAEAKGVAGYHLGLGQVYHRLGKVDEGEAEFAGLLARGEPELALAVVEAYRELGLEARARAEARKLVDGEGQVAHMAAVKLALMAHDRDEKRSWLEKADQSDPFVRNELASLEGDALFEAGDRAGADRKYAENEAFFRRQAATNPAAANNAALVLVRRYDCTSDPKHIAEAVRLMESARELAPDNGLLVGNSTEVREIAVVHATVGQWMPLDRLGLTTDELSTVLDALLDGPERDAVRAALKRNPETRRLVELCRQAEVLAPNRPESWSRERRWLDRLDDEAGLVALRDRMKGVPLDHAAAEVAWKASLASGADEAGGAQVEMLEARIGRTTRGGPARAALALLKARALYGLAYWSADPAQAAAAAAAYDEAAAAWAPVGATAARADATLAAALFAQMASDEALRSAWLDEGRGQGLLMFVRGRAGLDGLRPAAEAAAALRRDAAGRRGLDDWLMAQIAGDAALEAAAAPALSTPAARARVEIAQMLAPFKPGNAALLALLR